MSRGVLGWLKAGPVEVEFDQELAEVREELRKNPELSSADVSVLTSAAADEHARRLAEISPRAAVLEAFTRVESQLAQLLAETGVNPLRMTSRVLADKAHEADLVSDESLAAVRGLTVLRNLAAHSQDEIGLDRALDYLALTDAVLSAVRPQAAARTE